MTGFGTATQVGEKHISMESATSPFQGDRASDVNKDWTCKDKDKDQAYKDQDKDKDKD